MISDGKEKAKIKFSPFDDATAGSYWGRKLSEIKLKIKCIILSWTALDNPDSKLPEHMDTTLMNGYLVRGMKNKPLIKAFHFLPYMNI